MPGNLPNVPPPDVAASWPAPNYVDPPVRGWLPAYAISLHILASAFVALRYALRGRDLLTTAGLDDAFLLMSWLCATVFTALAVNSSWYGLIDRHIWDVVPSKYTAEALNVWLASFVFLVGTCFIKISVLLFYRRFRARTYSLANKVAVWIAVIFTVVYSLSLVLALIFNCRPTQAYWQSYDPLWAADHEFTCAKTTDLNVVAGGLSILSDLYAILLPCSMVQGLHMSRRDKIGLNFVFALGLVTVAAAAGRTWAFHELSISYDLTWTGFWVDFWAILEFELGMICACLPSLRKFVIKYFGAGVRKSGKNNSANSNRALRQLQQNDIEFENLGGFGYGEGKPYGKAQAIVALI